jgi:hypothetical protein
MFVPKKGGATTSSERKELLTPPNSPNEKSSNDLIELSPKPGKAKRMYSDSTVEGSGDESHSNLANISISPIHLHLQQSSSAPITPLQTYKPSKTTRTLDPADRECLERFLKINARHITDGQGVVGGVLLITPNALMFDPNVSDPLVIEHGTEQYGVTVPMEMVLKTALYSDIAHMRVKHAPEAVPSAPRPEVYYAPEDELEDDLLLKASCGQIIGTNLDKSPNSELVESKTDVTSDTLVESKTDATSDALVENKTDETSDTLVESKTDETSDTLVESKTDATSDTLVESKTDETSDTLVESKTDVTSETLVEDNCNANVEQIESIEKIDSNDSTNQESDQMQSTSNEPIVDLSLNDNKDEDKGKASDHTSDEHKSPEEEIPDEKTLETIEIESKEVKIEKENEEVINENDNKNEQQSDSNEKETEKMSKPENPVYNKVTLGIRHSVPETTLHERKPTSTLVTAISAEDSASVDKRRSAQGESRREQMLKRLSNPVDKIGNLTKSGISSGISATKTGISSGISATKTGFNKVLATPKNIVEFSSGLVRDAKDALSSGSKGDSLESDLEVFSKGTANSDNKKHLSTHGSDNRQSSIGYQNMVDTKIDVFANFESKSFKTS